MADPRETPGSTRRSRGSRTRRRWAPARTTHDRPERRLGWLRLLGGGLVLAVAATEPTGPPRWVVALVVVAGVSLATTGLVTLVVIPRVPAPPRATQVLGLSDAVALASLLPLGVARGQPWVVLVFTLLAVLGGLRLGRLGVLRNLVVAAPFETVRLVVGASRYDDRDVVTTVVAILVAIGIGVLVADVASSGRRARRDAADRRAAARRDRVRVRRLRWEQDVVADVLRAAGTGTSSRALATALARIHQHLDLVGVQLLSAGGDELVVIGSTDGQVAVGTVVEVLPGGPRDRALSLGAVSAASHDDLAAIAAASGRTRGSAVAAPLPVGGRLLGLLVCESAAGDLLHHRDADLVGRLGRALAPFVALAADQGHPTGSAGATGTDPGPG